MWNIYDKGGLAVKCVADELEYNGTWMGESYVTVSIKSPTPISFSIGDYLIYRGERFEINYNPASLKKAHRNKTGDAFTYDRIKFNSLSDELSRCDFLDVVLEDNNVHFTSLPKFSFFAASIQDLADRIQANLNRLYTGDKAWTVEVHPEYVNKTNVNIDVQNIKVWGALELCVKNFGAYFIVRGRHIIIGTAGIETGQMFRFGKGNGLYEILQESESDQQIITRLRAYGNTTNMPHRYYNKLADAELNNYLPNNMAVDHLMLPGFPKDTLDPFVESENVSILGVREGTVFFDGSNDLPDIHPSLEGMTATQLRNAGINVNLPTGDNGNLDELAEGFAPEDDGEWAEGETIPNFTIKIKDVGFDINDYLTTEDAVISMKSGMCGGREFNIVRCKKVGNEYELTCQRVEDNGLGLHFPNRFYRLDAGDKFVLLHIEMPEVYIKAASQRLLEEAEAYLAKNDYTRFTYTPKVDDIYVARQHDTAMASEGLIASIHDTIKEGDLMLFEDVDLGIDANVVIDNLVIKEGSSQIPKYTVTLRNEKSVGTMQKIQNQIDSLTANQGAGILSTAQIKDIIKTLGREEFISRKLPDSAAGLITFLQGLRTGQYVQGGKGSQIDAAGNAEVESIVVRSFMKVYELIYNRINALEGTTSFADVGTIDDVAANGNLYSLTMRKRWDMDFTAFQPGDIVYGYVNDLTSTGVYYKSWMLVTSVDRANNILTVSLYPNTEVPAGRNYPPTAEMVISRWGNAIAPNETTHNNSDYSSFIHVSVKDGITQYTNTRQTSFFISCEDGNVVELMGVDKPVLERWNYGAILGQLPSGLLPPEKAGLINDGQPYLYARGVVVQDLIRIDYAGQPIQEEKYRGEWSLQTAQSPTEYYQHTDTRYDTVTHNGRMWQCIANGNVDEPSDDNGSWMAMTNDTHAHMSVWSILPSAYLVSIRQGENGHADIIPGKLTCKIRKESTDGNGTYDDTYNLLMAGAKLFYSLDGENWHEFIMGEEEPLELEDGTGNIEAENSTDETKDYLTVGGDDVDTENISDRIFFELRDAISDEVLTTAIVPVVKDGVSYVGTIDMYAWSNSNETYPPKDAGVWATVIPPRYEDTTYRYLWNYEIVVYSNGERKETEPHCASVDGREIVDFEEKYMATASNEAPSAASSLWSDTATLSNEKPYLWNKEIVLFSDGSESDPIIHLVAQKGEDGKGYEYIFKLTSEYVAPNVPTATSNMDDFVPAGWDDDPPQVDTNNKYCWMVYRKKVDGVWSAFIGSADQPGKAFLWCAYGEQGDDGQSVYTSVVYRRSNTDLSQSAPTGGSFITPVPNNWSAGIPSGDERVWCSTRIFTSDGEAPQEPQWSTPRPMTDTADFDVEYSSAINPGTPGAPNPGGINSNPNWTNDATDTTIWMATNVRRNGVWEGWRISKIKGEQGDNGQGVFASVVYKRSNADLSGARPIGGSFDSPIPSGWSGGIPSGDERVWCSTRIFTSDGEAPQEPQWSTPRPMTDTADFDVEYSSAINPGTPGAPNPGGINSNPNWQNTANENTIWMATNVKRNGSWEGWRISKIKGEQGDPGVPGADGLAISVSLSQEHFIFRKGHPEANLKVYVDVFVNGEQIKYSSGLAEYSFTCQALKVGTNSGQLTNGLRWGFNTDNGRFYYTFTYTGAEIDKYVCSPKITVLRNGVTIAEIEKTITFRSVLEGRDGLMAYPAGEYDPSVTYSATGDTTPIVLCEGEYYMLKGGCSYTGNSMAENRNTPRKDYVNGGDNSSWRLVDRFNSIFANVLMAEFAKLGSAVFFKDWMISQQGSLDNGEGTITPDSLDYQYFKTGQFTPNLSINFSTGELIALMGKFTGEINATSGRMGNLRINGNYISGYDNDGNERVRIGIGDLPSVNDAFVSRFIRFAMSSEYADSHIIPSGSEGYYVQRIGQFQQSGYGMDGVDDMNVTAVCEFTLNSPPTKITFEDICLTAIKRNGTDEVGATAQSARLYYRANSGSSYVSVAMSQANALGQGSRWTVNVSNAGQYRLEISGYAYVTRGTDWYGLLRLGVGGIIATLSPSAADTPICTMIAKDGILSSQGANNYMLFTQSGGFEVRKGNYGFRVTSSGLQKLNTNQSTQWQTL